MIFSAVIFFSIELGAKKTFCSHQGAFRSIALIVVKNLFIE